MPDGWRELRLEDLGAPSRGFAMGPFGSSIKSENFVPEGVPVIRGNNLSGNAFRDCGFVFLTTEKADSLSNAEVLPGDLVLTHRGTIGQVAHVPETAAHPRYIASQSQMRARFDPTRADSRFMYYWFLSTTGQAKLLENTSQTGVPAIAQPLTSLKNIRLELPPLAEQRRIAGVLGAFDDLIDTNTLLASRAQSLAVALLEGAEEVTALSEVAVPVKATLFRPVGTVEHYSLPAFDAGGRPETVDGGEIKSGKQRLVAPSVLVSRLNPQTPRVWMSYPAGEAAASTEFVVLTGKDDVAVEEIWAACSSQTFASEMRSRVTGTTGSHQRVDKAAIPTIEVPDPRSLGTPHRRAVVSLVQEADGSLAQAAELAKIRDELLPLLMSGRITVDEAWEAVPG